jgi:enolase-phosphatase E1
MKADRKIGALKSFQGVMWKEGYASGELKGE